MGNNYPCIWNGGEGEKCQWCKNNNAPDSFDVTFAGYADASCTDCEMFNDTFVVTPTAACSCVYEFDISPAICSKTVVRLTIGGPTFSITVVITGAGHNTFIKNSGFSDTNCRTISSLAIPFDSGSLFGCGGGPTCTITAN